MKLINILLSDSEVILHLEQFKDNVEITTRKDGGLEIEIYSPHSFRHKTDLRKLRGFLKRNGFQSFKGIFYREQLVEPTRSVNFKQEPLISDKIFDIVMQNESIKQVILEYVNTFDGLTYEQLEDMSRKKLAIFKQICTKKF